MPKEPKRWRPGERVPARELECLRGARVQLPGRDALLHLQFRRFAGCPVCDLHLRSIARHHGVLTANGVRELVVFHSRAEELRAFGAHELPFAVIADPEKRLYVEFGVEASPRSLVNPRAWGPILRAIAATAWRTLRGRAPLRVPSATGGRIGLPADLLIARDGRVLAAKYGEHASDQWSVAQILEHVRLAGENETRAATGAANATVWRG